LTRDRTSSCFLALIVGASVSASTGRASAQDETSDQAMPVDDGDSEPAVDSSAPARTSVAPAPQSSSDPIESSEPPASPPTGLPAYVDFNAYYDTRDFATLTINTWALLPRGVSYFAFVDYTSAPGMGHVDESQAFYTEQNLQWGRWATFPLEVHAQWGLGASVGFDIPDVVRFGVRFHPVPTRAVGRAFERAHLTTLVTYFPLIGYLSNLRPDAFTSQISYFYRFEPAADRIDHRIYLQGFGDFDFRTGDGLTDVIQEHQLGVRIVAGLHVVAEVRYANFVPTHFGAGFGLEYRIDMRVPTE